MGSYSWNGGSGSFATAGNWLDVLNGDTVSTVVPGSLDAAIIDVAATSTISGNGTVAGLDLSAAAGTLALTGALAASAVSLDGGLVALSGNSAILVSAGLVGVGLAASASLDVLAASTVTIGQTAQDGFDNFQIGVAAGVNGAVTVNGSGSLLSSAAGAVGVGLNGSGILSVTQGGTVLTSAASYSDIEYGFYVGWQRTGTATGSGAVVVDGAGSVLGSEGQIAIGVTESGSLTVSDRAAVYETAVLPDGDPNILIGVSAGGSGFVTVTLGGVLGAGQGAIAVGMGGSGTLDIQQAGTVLAGNAQYSDVEAALAVGSASPGAASVTGSGVVAVQGAESLLDADGAIDDGDAGGGTLSVTDAGTVEVTGTGPNASANIVVGVLAGASGSLTVDGNASLLTAGGGRIAVGAAGAGSMTVSNGATAMASAAQYTDVEPALLVGVSAGGAGIVTVTNIGSTLTANGAAWIGGAGSGTLTVSYGGAMTAGGTNDGGTGLVVGGAAGAGVVAVTGGALVVVDAGAIGAQGSVTVTSHGTLALEGNLTLASGGTLDTDSTSRIAVGIPAGSGDPDVGVVDVFAGATLAGSGLVASGVTGGGTVQASGGTLEITGAATNATLALATHATLRVDGAVSAAVLFDAGSATLLLATAGTAFTGAVTFSGEDDRIERAGITITGASLTSPGKVTVVGTSDGAPTSFVLNSVTFTAGTPQTFTWGLDAATGDSYFETACFAEGTRIATTQGEVAVEALGDGDLVLSPWGERQPVVWRGWRHVDCARHPRPWDVWPVRVREGAFGPGLPRRDVRLSPDHAVFVAAEGGGGVLVPIRHLVNGASVVQEPAAAVAYWHVELPRHGILLAEGLPAESYLDTGNRHAFANGGGATMLHPDFALATWRAQGCAELVRDGARLAAVRRRLIGHLPALGFAVTEDAALWLEIDGRPSPRRRADGWLHVAIAAGARTLRLRSRSAAPADLAPASDDRRRLGVPLAALRIDGAAVPLDDARLAAGWHLPEPGLRWTNGDAALDVTGARQVSLAIPPGLLRYAVATPAPLHRAA